MTSGASHRSVHPFPARMAPEIAISECTSLEPGSVVVDPMVGSGTTVHAAAEVGCTAIGVDLDPLAVLMTRVRTTRMDVSTFLSTADDIVSRARDYCGPRHVDSIDSHADTRAFVDYWFAPKQQFDLRTLAVLIAAVADTEVRHALQVAFSRLIITKDKGASLARDVSHSRPHKVRSENDFDSLKQFRTTCIRLASILEGYDFGGSVTVISGDARRLPLSTRFADLVITSPPYLNAIDYLRGHRLSLVWLGFPVNQIRAIRAESVGSERGIDVLLSDQLAEMRKALGGYEHLKPRFARMVDRYLVDMSMVYAEQARILRRGGRAISVIGNSALRGAFLHNDQALTVAAEVHGLHLEARFERELPADRRYLPPPRSDRTQGLHQRMRTETILRFRRS